MYTKKRNIQTKPDMLHCNTHEHAWERLLWKKKKKNHLPGHPRTSQFSFKKKKLKQKQKKSLLLWTCPIIVTEIIHIIHQIPLASVTCPPWLFSCGAGCDGPVCAESQPPALCGECALWLGLFGCGALWHGAPAWELPGASPAGGVDRCLFSFFFLLWLSHIIFTSGWEKKQQLKARHGSLRNISWENFGYPEVITEESIWNLCFFFVAVPLMISQDIPFSIWNNVFNALAASVFSSLLKML